MADQLTCGACGFSNEPERVYCHNCGAKLDRSLLPVVEQDKKQESVEAARRRIKKMTNPAGYTFGQFLKSMLKVLFFSALLASCVLQLRKPDGVPDEKGELPTRLIQSELMEAIQSPTPRAISFSEADVNGALKIALRRATAGGAASMDTPKRAYANLMPGVIRIGVVHDLWEGMPMYSSVDYKLSVENGKFIPTLTGGSVGRMPFHPKVMKYFDYLFRKFWTTVKREHEQMNKMQSVQVSQGQISFVTKGGGGDVR